MHYFFLSYVLLFECGMRTSQSWPTIHWSWDTIFTFDLM